MAGICTGCIAALIITLLTVSFQAIKAAIANPVKIIKNRIKIISHDKKLFQNRLAKSLEE